MLVNSHHVHYARHVSGASKVFAFGAVAKVLLVILAFALAVVARYVVTQWAEKQFDDQIKANLLGWLAFLVVLIVVGLGGWRVL